MNTSRQNMTKTFTPFRDSASIDATDAQILAILMADGRTSNVDIARTIGTSEATVRRRIQAMLDDGLMEVIAVADPYRLGLQVQVIIGFTVELHRINDIAEELSTLEPIRFLAFTTGPYDLIAQAYFAHNEEIYPFISEQLAHIPGITRTETVTVLKIMKRTWDFQLESPQDAITVTSSPITHITLGR
jgi:Lrp/AsnC family transcriptional regulator for asnA, asnC and gidA